MRTAASAVVLLVMTAHACADPLTDVLGKSGGRLCYDRVYDTAHLAQHPRQRTRAIRISLTDYPETGGANIRVAINESTRAHYILGECYWAEEANLDSTDEPLLPSFGRKAGLNCHAITTTDGSSAEEGGDFPVDLRDGANIILHLPDSIAGWKSLDDVSGAATFFELGPDDRVFRLDRADMALCTELNEKLPWLL